MHVSPRRRLWCCPPTARRCYRATQSNSLSFVPAREFLNGARNTPASLDDLALPAHLEVPVNGRNANNKRARMRRLACGRRRGSCWVPRQLQVFDEPGPDDRGWSCRWRTWTWCPSLGGSVDDRRRPGWLPWTGNPELTAGLPFSTRTLWRRVEWLRAAYAEAPDPRAQHVPAVYGTEAGRHRADVRRDAGEAVAVVGEDRIAFRSVTLRPPATDARPG